MRLLLILCTLSITGRCRAADEKICDFEEDCATVDSSGGLTWRRTNNAGSLRAYKGEWFMYATTEGGGEGRQGSFSIKDLNVRSGKHRLSFSWHMTGSGLDKLQVIVVGRNGQNNVVWSSSESSDDSRWINENLVIPMKNREKLLFKIATVATGSGGEVVVDNVKLSEVERKCWRGVSTCENNRCSGNSTCVRSCDGGDKTANYVKYNCKCNFGWTGMFCDYYKYLKVNGRITGICWRSFNAAYCPAPNKCMGPTQSSVTGYFCYNPYARKVINQDSKLTF